MDNNAMHESGRMGGEPQQGAHTLIRPQRMDGGIFDNEAGSSRAGGLQPNQATLVRCLLRLTPGESGDEWPAVRG